MARTKGSINKNSRGLLARLKMQYGEDFDPILRAAEAAVQMNDIAMASGELHDLKECVAAWEKIAKYTTPQLKAVEVDVTSGGNDLPTIIELVAKK